MIQGPNLEFNKNVFTHNIKKLRMIVIRFKVCHYFPIHYGKVCPMGKQFSILTRTWIGNETIVKGMNPCSTKPIGCLNPTLTTVPCKKIFFWGGLDLQYCDYCHLPSDSSSKFPSSTVIFHHKLLTRECR